MKQNKTCHCLSQDHPAKDEELGSCLAQFSAMNKKKYAEMTTTVNCCGTSNAYNIIISLLENMLPVLIL